MHALDKPENQEVKLYVISYVKTFLKLRDNFRQYIVSKDYISMNNGDDFIKFAR